MRDQFKDLLTFAKSFIKLGMITELCIIQNKKS